MAEPETTGNSGVDGDDDMDATPGYKPPAVKSLDEIRQLDADDDSLVRYKQQLLGQTDGPGEKPFPNRTENVIVSSLSLIVEDRPNVVLDLKGDISQLMKTQRISIKEGAKYKLQIAFYVQEEIVSGLLYLQSVKKSGIKVDSDKWMIGSYGPKPNEQVYLTPIEEAPSGLLSRGKYNVHSKFTDDDKRIYLEWDWGFEIKKDWD